jgi:hypothetical protein
VPAPDFSPGRAGFQTRENVPAYKLRALALVASAETVSDFSAVSLALRLS